MVCYVESSERVQRKFVWFAAALLSFIAALFTKEQAIFALALFVSYEWFFHRRGEGHGIVPLYRLGILMTAAVGYLSCRQLLFGSLTSAVFENIGELKLRLLTIPRIIETFISLIVFPRDLHYYRSVDMLAPYTWPLIVFVALSVGVAFLLRSLPDGERKKAGFGLVWFVIFLFPALNVIPLVNEYSFLAEWEHSLYLPIAGFLIFASAAAGGPIKAFVQRHSQEAAVLAVLFVAVFGFLTIRQNNFWNGEIPLFEQATTFEPQLGRVHVLLAKAYMFNGRLNEALAEFQKAEAIMRAYAGKATTAKAQRFYEGFLKGIYSDAAQCDMAKGNFDLALAQYNHALIIDPKDDRMYANRALVFLQKGQVSDGIHDLQTALSLNPGDVLAANNLSIAFIQSGQIDRARQLLNWILLRNPDFTAARDNLRRLNHDSQPR
jgi:tetratricopeptide (TPR) repeat protein